MRWRKIILFLTLFFYFPVVAMAMEKGLVDQICTHYEERDFLLLARDLRGITPEDLEKGIWPDCLYRAAGTFWYLKGEYEASVSSLLKVGKPTLLDIVNTSSAYIKLSRLEKAKELLSRAYIKYGDKVGILYNLAIVYVKEGSYSRARGYLFKVLNLPVEDDIKTRALNLLNYIGY